MNWININVDTINSVEFISSEPTERATWLSLLAWCCQQENGGMIENSKSWGNRLWQQLCGVTSSEVHAESKLFHFVGENLVVMFYPHDQEAALKAKRDAGKKGGRPKALKNKGKKPYGLVEDNHMVNHDRNVIVKESNSNSNSKEVPPKSPKGEIDLPFNSDQFREAWEEWTEYRKEIRKPWEPSTIKSQFKKMRGYPESDIIFSIRQSIENGWLGLFYENKKQSPANTSLQNPNQYD